MTRSETPEKRHLERPQPGLDVDAYRLLNLLRGRGRPLHDTEQPVVGDEGDVIEIDPALHLDRQVRILGEAVDDHAAEQAGEESTRQRSPDAGSEILRRAAQLAHVAGEFPDRRSCRDAKP